MTFYIGWVRDSSPPYWNTKRMRICSEVGIAGYRFDNHR